MTSARIASLKETMVVIRFELQYLQVNVAYCKYDVCVSWCSTERLTGHKEHKPVELLRHGNLFFRVACISANARTHSAEL
jgi:hypothetical protein